jgi:hypothetical protein
LQANIRQLNARGKTPILLASEAAKAALLDNLAKHGGSLVVDTRPFVLPIAKYGIFSKRLYSGSFDRYRTGIKFPDAVESLRCACVAAKQNGNILVLDCTDKTPGFRDKICEHPKFKV